MRYKIIILAVASLMAPTSYSHELRGNVAVEYRQFFKDGFENQFNNNVSLSAQPEYFHQWDNGDQLITFTPFARLDQRDDERTHFDIRELSWLGVYGFGELRLGIRKLFWGVTESQHLVDIINQTDFVENIDGEDKLGQPMINAAFIQDWGTVDLYVLTGFRERTFPGAQGRPRSQLIVDKNLTEYESSDEEKHIDFAARYYHYIGVWEFGVSHFYGTSRDPNLIPTLNTQNEAVLKPFYPIINQTSLDLQAILSNWLLKLELISRDGQDKDYGRYSAATGGFEYTVVGIFKTIADLGIISEYLYDERGSDADPGSVMASPFQNDLFLGARLALNDVQSTAVLAGLIIDLDRGDRFYNIEAERRLGDAWKLSLEARVFALLDETNPLRDFNNDDYAQLNLEWFF
ncbi:MAG: hypothetical protein AMJ53_15940 [Gammaproteobacteria bacterium SG8_11]|nr:MAG: hypothetical protein AMJ53_15940 [Gammaproteobacteria bacterium SG8_11]